MTGRPSRPPQTHLGRVFDRLRRARRRTSPFHRRHPHGGQGGLKPARVFLLLFVTVDLLGTGLLLTPAASTGPDNLTFVEALFTATTALAVCGLSIISIGGDLTHFGQGVVLALMQVGGMGIMTVAALLGTAVVHRFGLRMQLNVQAETKSLWVGDVRGLVSRVSLIFLTVQSITFALITPRMWLAYDMELSEALYSGLFHSVSAFNNAGLSLYDDSMTQFSGDALVLFPIALAVVLGGIGFPVIIELWRRFRLPRAWSLHTKITLTTSAVLLAGASLLIPALEWNNAQTLGELHWWARITDGVFHGVMPRSGGLNVTDVGAMEDSTLLFTIMLMFVGGGSAGTAGGIKVATLAVISCVIFAEVRSQDRVHVFDRQLPAAVIRQSLSLIFMSATVVAFCTLLLLATTSYNFLPVLFEMVSAVGVVGLSMGLTPELPPWAQSMIIVLMAAGRIGPITFVTALAMSDRKRRYALAEDRPVIG
ncbi:TrkH family potassium uptake protein [Nocardiopsis salina]|uniref:TrkH family potassium uptake protein n=1 Tax=Nocardiopsis salina TaxID=245836 RepID=UPI0009FCA0F9|nr:potassium transporter TrkG [Nocardiopsis salina]